MSGKKGNARPETKKRYGRGRTIKDQLQGGSCDHKGRAITQTNAKGKEFQECGRCGAFLGWS